MTVKEMLNIIMVVVEYGWMWQHETLPGRFETPINQTLHNMFTWILERVTVRLDPDHPWDWPIESREGMPVWAKVELYGPDPIDWEDGEDIKSGENWEFFDSKNHARTHVGIGTYRRIVNFVAPHPLAPDTPPPDDWTPEGKRMLA